MGRPKNFSRDGVLEKAIPVFWERGFADTSLQDLESATGVNKSGLYAEFKGKEDLFLESLRYYVASRPAKEILAAKPLGLSNVEKFLTIGYSCWDGQRGCFSVNSMREFAVLPPEAHEIVADSLMQIKRLLIKNIQAEGTKTDPAGIAEIVMTFFSGICIEQNLKGSKGSTNRKIESLMQMIRQL